MTTADATLTMLLVALSRDSASVPLAILADACEDAGLVDEAAFVRRRRPAWSHVSHLMVTDACLDCWDHVNRHCPACSGRGWVLRASRTETTVSE